MAWRLARSLIKLGDEVNAAAPHRSKSSDGTIGDQAHASRCSRHNPNNAGVVCARDLTHDPAGGFDAHAQAEIQVGMARAGWTNPDFDYVISNARVAGRSTGWTWRAYKGSNPHTKHVHFAVGSGSDCEPGPSYDTSTSWGISSTPAPAPGPAPTPPAGDNMKERVMALPMLRRGAKGQFVRNMQGLLVANGQAVSVDGDFGPGTEAGLKAWQKRAGLSADGICGPNTWARLVGV